MQTLELKVPPPLVAALIGASMWLMSKLTPLIALPDFVRTDAAAIFAMAGAALTAAGVMAFRQRKTTVNPMKPQAAAMLVREGIYSVSRNPMYLGLLVMLLAWAAFLSTAWALLGPLIYVLYINRFQIAPEERILSAKFGASYADYKARVRQWL